MSTHPSVYPRQLERRIAVAMQDTPVVLVNGPRQSGKTTLIRSCSSAMPYYTLDDDNILHAARQDPAGFVRRMDTAVIDEIQRAPELMRAIKHSVDEDRRSGRFLITGSANLLALPKIGDSLAGRMEILTLYPLSLSEIRRNKASAFYEHAENQSWPLQILPEEPADIVETVLTGGYPEMLARSTAARRVAWARSYIRAIVERDVRDISSVEKLVEMPRLLEALAQQSGKQTNFTQIGGQLNMDTKTVQKYTGLLETLFLVHSLRPWHANGLKRIIKSPKIHFLDSGLLACLHHISRDSLDRDKSAFGALLETWVYGELLKMSAVLDEPWSVYYYRDKDQVEVDFVLETPSHGILGIEVKASQTVFPEDFRGLRKLAGLSGNRWMSGMVLYDGKRCLPFGENLWAVPLGMLG